MGGECYKLDCQFFEKKLEKTGGKPFAFLIRGCIFALGNADMAQLVEQRIRNAWVLSSSLSIGSFLSPDYS